MDIPSSRKESPHRLRIAVVTTVHTWGDPRVFEREVATMLEWEHEVHVFVSLDKEPDRKGWSANPRLQIHPLPVPAGRVQRGLLALGVWWRVFQAGPFHVVHFQDPELIPAMGMLTLVMPRAYFLYDIHEELPLEVESKGYIPPCFRKPVAWAARALWAVASRLFDGFAPATEAIARHWPPHKTRIVHNYPKATYAAASRDGSPLDPARLIYIGALTEIRGIREVLDGFREASRIRPELKLDLVGPITDNNLEGLVASVVKEGLCRHFPWLPPEQLASFAQGAGIGLVPYLPQPDHLEALPTKIFEYMAMGIPILASDFPLWKDLIEHAGIGLVVPPTAADLARGILAMTADAKRLNDYRAKGIQAYNGGFRWETEQENLRWHLRRAVPDA